MPECKHVKADGECCRAQTVGGSTFCFFHDPVKATERKAAQKAGGRANRLSGSVHAEPIPLKTSSDVASLIAETINQVRRSELDPRTANALGYLSNVLLKALEQGDIQTQLETLERVVLPRMSSLHGDGCVGGEHPTEKGFAC